MLLKIFRSLQYSLIFFVLFFNNHLGAQVIMEWSREYNVTNSSGISFIREPMAIDENGNTYSISGDDRNYLLLKYNSSGVFQWSRSYNGPNNRTDFPVSVKIYKSDNIYVTGVSYNSDFDSDILTIKYNSNGDSLWTRRYGSPFDYNDEVRTMNIDRDGNILLAGLVRLDFDNSDYLTIKYNSQGDTLWTRRYNDSLFGFPTKVIADNFRNVYVTGSGQRTQVFEAGHYTTLKYDPAGNLKWSAYYNGITGSVYNVANDIAIDNNRNVFVTGNSPRMAGFADDDCVTIKYDSNGIQSWIRRYNGSGFGSDYGNAIALDTNNGSVIICGGVYSGSPSYFDYLIIKYSSIGGLQWLRTFSGVSTSWDDIARSITLDSLYNIYITGEFGGEDTSSGIATIKYSNSGDLLWSQIYSSNPGMNDEGKVVKTDKFNNVYVSGVSWNSSTSYNQLIIKYSQTTSINLEGGIPYKFSLSQNYPNPFNPTTVIRYSLNENGLAILKVYDILGNEVAILVNEKLNPGNYSVDFDGVNYPSGIYYYKFEAGDFSEVKKMILLK